MTRNTLSAARAQSHTSVLKFVQPGLCAVKVMPQKEGM